ncbi:MAG: hypothetical protein ACOY0T_18235 [Myxococcota bacterium]
MPLEFALRPRINLERPARRRRAVWMRLPPLALPIGCYWLTLAAVFWALYPSGAPDAASVDTEHGAYAPQISGDLPADNVSPTTATAIAAPVAETEAASSPEMTAMSPPSLNHPASRDSDVTELATDAAEPSEPANIAHPPITRRAERSQHESSQHGSSPHKPSQHEPLQHEPRALARTDASIRKRPASASSLAHATSPSRQDPTLRADSEPHADTDATAARSLPSCEAAAESANQMIDFGSTQGTPDITRDAFAGRLENGAYLSTCAIPASTALEICAAVQNGKVVGVSVSSEPRSSAINACVRHAVSSLRFPSSPRLDVTRTRFAAGQ